LGPALPEEDGALVRDLAEGTMVRGDCAFDLAAGILGDGLRRQQVTLFTGAGVSLPSGLPGSSILVESLVKAMSESLARLQIGSAVQRSTVEAILSRYPLERLLDSIVGVLGEEAALDFLGVLQDAEENYNHSAVAEAARRRWVTSLITLNFDLLYEQALQKQLVPFVWQLPLVRGSCIPETPAQVTLVKPHGTLRLRGLPYHRQYLAATLQYAGDRPQQETRQVFAQCASNHPVLLVAGYRDDDWDILPALLRAPWSHVIWCQFVRRQNADTDPPENLSPRVKAWLEQIPTAAFLLRGEVRDLLSSVLEDGNVGRSWKDIEPRRPNTTVLQRYPARTVLAAVRLLDGADNALYGDLLPKIGALPEVTEDVQLRRRWVRSAAWYFHAHRMHFRRCTRVPRSLISERAGTGENTLDYMGDLRSLYYAHLSATKRPWLNPIWPLDLVRAHGAAKALRRETCTDVHQTHPTRWEQREYQRLAAQLEQYKADLMHNWGYHLLPFPVWPVRALTRRIFSVIMRRYSLAARRFPVLDWEYYLVRHAESALIAGERQVVSELLTRPLNS
jgi:hypothetical protein